jgi:hypothetical protein
MKCRQMQVLLLGDQTNIHISCIDIVVIDDRTCEERLWKMKRQRYTNFYLCEVSSNMVIDATNKGNKSRFINHSCEPNTEMQKWLVILYCLFYIHADDPDICYWYHIIFQDCGWRDQSWNFCSS